MDDGAMSTDTGADRDLLLASFSANKAPATIPCKNLLKILFILTKDFTLENSEVVGLIPSRYKSYAAGFFNLLKQQNQTFFHYILM